MMFDSISWGSYRWLLPVACLTVVALGILLHSYRRTSGAPGLRLGAGALKAFGICVVALCLLEPLYHGTRPRPGANLFVLLADNSESMNIRDRGQERSRGELLQELLEDKKEWRSRLGQDFDVREYLFDSRLRAVNDLEKLTLKGKSTALESCLAAVERRYRGRPVAGILLLTDGNATDGDGPEFDASKLPPVYPVLLGEDGPERDIGIRRITVSQTQFESAPVTIQVQLSQRGYTGQKIITQILDTSGKEVEKDVQIGDDSGRVTARIQMKPEQAGVHFYRVRTCALSELNQFEKPQSTREATLANNNRLVVVERNRGPYRVLYVSGRPNWEFKFLRRALEEDREVEIVGLIRIAKREPKFEFRSRYGESTNPLFRGFGKEKDEEAERYDQPVLLRLGTLDEEELRDGFPKAADQLYRYHALVLDDLEAEYFTRDQMSLIRSFVSQRGGGFLMLGGQESFAKGKYNRTPIEELLPVYIDAPISPPAGSEFQLLLTREGWMQPWVRLRKTEEDERRRLVEMPGFRTLNPTQGIKPGGTVLARVRDGNGNTHPALVAQPFGKGRSAALLIGDLWRWHLRRKSPEESDQAKAWRQTVRWLVANVPGRIETNVESSGPDSPVQVSVKVRDEVYEPLENAAVVIEVSGPDGKSLELEAETSASEAGRYEASYTPRQAGAYRARVKVRGPDGSELGEGETGWTAEPAASEYRRLDPDRGRLERLARDSGGELVEARRLEKFVSTLQSRKIPITDPWIFPLWHQWPVLLFAMLCLCGEWALRRWRGLP